MKGTEPRSEAIAYSLNLLMAGFALSIEMYLLREILLHPAGRGEMASMLLWKFLAIAAIPYIIFFALCVTAKKRLGKYPTQFYMFILSILGVISCFLALRQYSHATPGFLMVGYVSQWLVILTCVYSRYK